MPTTTRTSEQIRNDFLTFFEEKGHAIVSSASLVPHGDPTLLFTNAGMNQFKDVFLGTGSRPYRRAVNTQKCLRVSGKHNDLEEVGHDTYHHTFFEMLGNWSFGDYFKKEAVFWAWELLVERWGLDPSRLYATVHEGDEALGLRADDEVADFWKHETSIRPDQVLYCPSKDNFWMMGDTGPCGPCSEIHIDLRPDEERERVPGSTLVNADDPRVMEIWNLVFIQYNAQADGSLQPLAAKHVDTGMGFERVVAVLQGKTSNYDTDLFAPLLQAAAELSPIKALRGYDTIEHSSDEEHEKLRVAMRVVADHIRTLAFAIGDGVTPGNVGRGYVIRRILRRAVRYGYQYLGLKEPFLFKLVEPLQQKTGDTFPEIRKQQSYIERVIRAEEESFLNTLEAGLAFFSRVTPYLKESVEARSNGRDEAELVSVLARDAQTIDLLQKAYAGFDRGQIIDRFIETGARKQMPGEIAFLLHDTYGFPVDLTELMAREEGFEVDVDRFDELMLEQKNRARAAASFKTDHGDTAEWRVVSDGEHSEFVGYETDTVSDARIRMVRSAERKDGDRHYVVLDATPFYAESGGQIGDTGVLRIGDEEIRVLDTRKDEGRIAHEVERLPRDIDAPVAAVVDADRRRRIKKHHTATHLMHAALRELLGTHVAQKGSLVTPDRLRFDFSHFERVTPDELRRLEERVNEVIQRNVERIEERNVPVEEALRRGAVALFGEKYGDTVRVITFDPGFSMELCGGTHVDATGELGLFRFISEGSVASGIRRVEAVAGMDAHEHIQNELENLEMARAQFRTLNRPVHEEIAALLDQVKHLEKQLASRKEQAAVSQLDGMIQRADTVDGIRVVTGRIDEADMNTLLSLGEIIRGKLSDSGVAVLGSSDTDAGKVYLVAAVSDDLIKRGLKAGELVGKVARIVGGGGGGRPTLASAGGHNPEKLDEALGAVKRLVAEAMA